MCAVERQETRLDYTQPHTAAVPVAALLAAEAELAAVDSIGELVAVVEAVDIAAAGSEEGASADRVSGFGREVEAVSGVVDTVTEVAEPTSRCVVEGSVSMAVVVPAGREEVADMPTVAETAAVDTRIVESADVAAVGDMPVVRVADGTVEVVPVADLVDALGGKHHMMVVRLLSDSNMNTTAAEAAWIVEEDASLQMHY